MSTIAGLVDVYRDLSHCVEKAIIDGDEVAAVKWSDQLTGVDQELHSLGCHHLQQWLADERHYSILVANNSRPHANILTVDAQRDESLLRLAGTAIDNILTLL